MRHGTTIVLSAAILTLGASASAVRAGDDAQALADVAAQVRLQGLDCDSPASLERVDSLSRPDEPAYVLKCEEKSYLVRIVPDQAAKVTVVD